MALSNTAVPKYYGEFRKRVLAGEEPVCENIEMQMNLIDDLIRNPSFYYDDRALDGFVKFCENELTLTDGEDVNMLDYFCLWAEDLLSWFYFEEKSVYVPYKDRPGGHYIRKRLKKRLRNVQMLILGRGGAKSMYDSFIQSYFISVDPTTTHQIVVAPTMRQCDEIVLPVKTAITRHKGPLFTFMTEGSIQNTTGSNKNRPKLAATKKGIENFVTNSLLEVRPLSIDKLQGLRCKVATVDEWLSGDVRENPFEAIEQGASKVDDYVIIGTSSEGTVRNGSGDDIKMQLLDVLKGKFYNPHMSIWYYKLDDVKEVKNPALWKKANPGLGKTVSYETYQLSVEKAEKVPSLRNDILAKRFGIPSEGFTYFFKYEETKKGRKREYWGMPCAMGADMSKGDDFCAFDFLFPINGKGFGLKTRCYITETTLNKLPSSLRNKYDTFISEGSLIILPGITLDMEMVYDDTDRYISESNYDVRAFGYDPYNAKYYVNRWEVENGPYGITKVIQGARTESVPLGDIKSLVEKRALFFDQEIISFTMQNAITIEDTNGNRKLHRKRSDKKIDCVAALIDAYVGYKENQDLFD